MAAEAEATREAKAKVSNMKIDLDLQFHNSQLPIQVIAAEGEHKSSRALKDAADILSESSSAIQLRYLQTLNNIAAEKNSTIVFPLPMELLSFFLTPESNVARHKRSITSVDPAVNSQHSPSIENDKNRASGKRLKNKGRDLTDL